MGRRAAYIFDIWKILSFAKGSSDSTPSEIYVNVKCWAAMAQHRTLHTSNSYLRGILSSSSSSTSSVGKRRDVRVRAREKENMFENENENPSLLVDMAIWMENALEASKGFRNFSILCILCVLFAWFAFSSDENFVRVLNNVQIYVYVCLNKGWTEHSIFFSTFSDLMLRVSSSSENRCNILQ